MSRYNIYVDFEAIDRSLVRILRLNIDFMPFCYTIGTYTEEKKFITETSILDFKKMNAHNVYYLLAEKLKKDIKKITNNPDLVINNRTIKFIGWNPFLENKITNKIFKMPTFPQVKYDGVSLDTITKNGNFTNSYFSDVSTVQSKNKLYVRTMKFNKPGCTASYVGFVLYKYFKNQKIYKLDMDSAMANSFLCNMKIYSNDDVVKMHYVNKNFEVISAKINKVKMLRKKIQDNNNNLKLYSIFVIYLTEYYKTSNPKLEDINKNLEKLLEKIRAAQHASCPEIDFKMHIEIAHVYKLIDLIKKIKVKYVDLVQFSSFLEKKINKLKKVISKDKENLEITLFKE